MRGRRAALVAVPVAGAFLGVGWWATRPDPPRVPVTQVGDISADEVRAFLETDPRGRSALGLAPPGEPIACGLDLLGAAPTGRTVYVWAVCEAYPEELAAVGSSSGVALPLRVDLVARTAQGPADGAGYTASVEAMFPREVAEAALDHGRQVDLDEVERAERAERAGAGG